MDFGRDVSVERVWVLCCRDCFAVTQEGADFCLRERERAADVSV